MVDEKVSRMGTGSIPWLIAEFSIPAILGVLVNGAYNVIDSIFLGQAMREIGLATMTAAGPTMILFMALAMWVGAGGNALAALRLGEGRQDDAERSLGNAVTLSVALWLVVVAIALNPAALEAVLSFSGATADVMPHAKSFVIILSLGFIFQCIGLGVSNFIRTAGSPNWALATMLIGAASCTVLNYLFVLRWGWGIEGSALATVLGQALSCAAVLWYFLFAKGTSLKLRLENLKPHAPTVKDVLLLGLASFAVQAGMAVISFATNFLLVKYGSMSPLGEVNALASIGVVHRVASFATLPLVGISTAVQPLLGYNYGAGNIARVRKIFWESVLVATVLGLLLWVVVLAFPEPIIAVFGIEHEELFAFTVRALRIQVLLIPLVGFQVIGANYFQATGQAAKSTVLALTRQVLFLVPLLFVLPEVLPRLFSRVTGLDSLYMATPAADLLAVVTTAVLIALEMRRLKDLEHGAKHCGVERGRLG